jgi:hypothetical protein
VVGVDAADDEPTAVDGQDRGGRGVVGPVDAQRQVGAVGPGDLARAEDVLGWSLDTPHGRFRTMVALLARRLAT